jgi:uncharacterized protein
VTAAVGVLIGWIMGLTGAGGGVLAVPALVATLGLTMQQAAPVALVGVAAAATVGALEGLLRRVVRYRAAMVIAAAGFPTSAAGVWLAQRLPDIGLRALFVLVLLAVAWRQLGPSARTEAEGHAVAGPSRVAERGVDGRFIWTPRAGLGFAAIGAATGLVSGLLGVAGGFVLVPMLSRLTDLPARMLVGTSLMVTALITTFGAFVAATQGPGLPADLAVAFAVALTAGMLAGRWTVRRLPDRWIHRAFALLLLAVAAGMAVDVVRRLV